MEFLQENWYWAAMAVVSGGLFLQSTFKPGSKSVSPVEATLLINKEDAIVLDVRDSNEFHQGHIPNARHIPLKDLAQRLSELEKFREQTIIVNCLSGGRSAQACAVLKKEGFNQVLNLDGGISAWEQAGQPITKKRK